MFLAGVYSSNHFYKLFSRHALEHVALSPGLQCPLNLCVSFKRCEHDDARVWKLSANGHHGVDATDIGKPEIHEGDVRSVFSETKDRLVSIGCFGNQHHVGFISYDRRYSLPHKGMVVDAEDVNPGKSVSFVSSLAYRPGLVRFISGEPSNPLRDATTRFICVSTFAGNR